MVVFDLETQSLAAEVGGWGNKHLMRLAVGCTWDEQRGYQLWWEAQAGDLIAALDDTDVIVGFNINSFDFSVLSFYGDTGGFEDKSFDILDELFQQVRARKSLNHLAHINLGEAKTLESGVVAVELWRQGRVEELAAYCQKDVELTKRLFEQWQNTGFLWISETNYAIWPGLEVVEERRKKR